ncbi:MULTISPECIES: helix-turn-helix domain-containing protein [Actinomadura]|uniref:helix-turn-helix domain-containing protein n=1 Tax=Actinomadura TaxID=1988 RepID=UPI000429109A|nr:MULTISPECIES: helix-turn-helix domain-containing protein [Actinomadura]
MEFAGALRQAIQASGLTLERVRHRLERSGLTVSVATLSYWQRGRSRPRSRAVVESLEDVLGVAPGTLTALLDETAPVAGEVARPAAGRGALAAGPSAGAAAFASGLWPDPDGYARLVGQLDRSGDHRLERLGVHDVYRLDETGRTWTLSVRAVLRAAGDDIDRVVCVHGTGPAGDGGPGGCAASGLAAARYCRPGRIRAGDGLVAFELVFDRVLAAGDTAVVEYDLGPVTVPAGAGAPGGYDRRFPHPVQQYVAVVQFDGERLPARCYGFTAETADGPRNRLGELWVGTSGSANLAVANVRRGIVGLEWEWH